MPRQPITRVILKGYDNFANNINRYWIGSGADTAWATTANWLAGAVPNNSLSDHLVVFNKPASTGYTRQPTMGSNSVKGLVFTGSADVTITGNGISAVGGGGMFIGPSAGAVSFASVKFTANQSWNIGSGKTLTVTGVGSSTGTISKIGDGTITVSGSAFGSSYSGTFQLLQGTFNMNGTGSPMYAWGAGIMQIYGGIIDNTSGSSKTVNTGSVNNGIHILGDFQFSTSAGTASNNLTINNGSSVTDMGTGTRTITCLGSGTLTLGSNVCVLSAYAPISANIVKKGPGTLSVTSASYANTTVNEGTFIIADKRVAGTMTVDGGTLQINGRCDDSITVAGNAGSILRVLPSSSATFNAGGNLTFTNSTSKFVVSVFGGSAAAVLVMAGTVALNSVTVDFDQNVGLAPGTYTILTGTGGISGTATKGVGPLGAAGWSLSISGNNLRVTVT